METEDLTTANTDYLFKSEIGNFGIYDVAETQYGFLIAHVNESDTNEPFIYVEYVQFEINQKTYLCSETISYAKLRTGSKFSYHTGCFEAAKWNVWGKADLLLTNKAMAIVRAYIDSKGNVESVDTNLIDTASTGSINYLPVAALGSNGLQLDCFSESVYDLNFRGHELWVKLTDISGLQTYCKLMVRDLGNVDFREWPIDYNKMKEFPLSVMSKDEITILYLKAKDYASRIAAETRAENNIFERESRDLIFKALKEKMQEVFKDGYSIAISDWFESAQAKRKGISYLFRINQDSNLGRIGVKLDIDIESAGTHIGTKIALESPMFGFDNCNEIGKNKSLESVSKWIQSVASIDFAPLMT